MHATSVLSITVWRKTQAVYTSKLLNHECFCFGHTNCRPNARIRRSSFTNKEPAAPFPYPCSHKMLQNENR